MKIKVITTIENTEREEEHVFSGIAVDYNKDWLYSLNRYEHTLSFLDTRSGKINTVKFNAFRTADSLSDFVMINRILSTEIYGENNLNDKTLKIEMERSVIPGNCSLITVDSISLS